MTEPAKVLAYDLGGSQATAGIVDLGSLSVHCVRLVPDRLKRNKPDDTG